MGQSSILFVYVRFQGSSWNIFLPAYKVDSFQKKQDLMSPIHLIQLISLINSKLLSMPTDIMFFSSNRISMENSTSSILGRFKF